LESGDERQSTETNMLGGIGEIIKCTGTAIPEHVQVVRKPHSRKPAYPLSRTQREFMQISSTVYFPKPASANASVLAAEVSRLFPKFTGHVSAPGEGGKNDNLLRLGDTVIAILDFNLPQPLESLEAAFKVNFTWPEARQMIAQYTAHVMLVVMGEQQGFKDATAASHALAMAALALAGMHGAIAVFWAPSLALLRGKSVASGIEDIQAGRPPLGLWVAFSPWVDRETRAVGLFTIGLQEFVGREIEMVPRTEPLGFAVQRALSLAEYLLAKGPVVKDGDTIGYSNTERLKITFLDQGSKPVMQVLTEEIAL
jgi:Domain of unknown function (DUF4261)